MFDHMMEVNNLLPSFAKYNLTDRDVTFIKELIAGTVLEAITCSSEVQYMYSVSAFCISLGSSIDCIKWRLNYGSAASPSKQGSQGFT